MALHILNLERGLAPLSQTHELSFLFVLVIQDFVGKGLAQLSSTKSGKRSWGRDARMPTDKHRGRWNTLDAKLLVVASQTLYRNRTIFRASSRSS